MNIISAREFNQGASAVLRLSHQEPIFISKRGEISNVILSFAEYQRLVGNKEELSLADMLMAIPDVSDIELDFERENISSLHRALEWE